MKLKTLRVKKPDTKGFKKLRKKIKKRIKKKIKKKIEKKKHG